MKNKLLSTTHAKMSWVYGLQINTKVNLISPCHFHASERFAVYHNISLQKTRSETSSVSCICVNRPNLIHHSCALRQGLVLYNECPTRGQKVFSRQKVRLRHQSCRSPADWSLISRHATCRINRSCRKWGAKICCQI